MNKDIKKAYKGQVTTDQYGRKIPKHAHGTTNTVCYTSSISMIMESVVELYNRIVDKNLLIRRINVVAARLLYRLEKEREKDKLKLQKEKNLQLAMIDIKKKFGKNAILKGTSLEDGATGIQRNEQIGGHKA